MDTLEAIHTRRSIRTYEDRAVDPELVRQIIDAAMSAPSAGNVRPWQFIVLTDREEGRKVSVGHKENIPDLAIIAPEFVNGLPSLITDYWSLITPHCGAAAPDTLLRSS